MDAADAELLDVAACEARAGGCGFRRPCSRCFAAVCRLRPARGGGPTRARRPLRVKHAGGAAAFGAGRRRANNRYVDKLVQVFGSRRLFALPVCPPPKGVLTTLIHLFADANAVAVSGGGALVGLAPQSVNALTHGLVDAFSNRQRPLDDTSRAFALEYASRTLASAHPVRSFQRDANWMVDVMEAADRLAPTGYDWDVHPACLRLDALAAVLATALESATGRTARCGRSRPCICPAS